MYFNAIYGMNMIECTLFLGDHMTEYITQYNAII